jgi:flagellar hook-basal body complex protein FliE
MSISPIAPVTANFLPVAGVGTTSAVTQPAASFTQLLGQALDQLNGAITQADQLSLALAAGQPVDVHDVMVALETASIGLELAMQVRNRALDAYREIMGMSV